MTIREKITGSENVLDAAYKILIRYMTDLTIFCKYIVCVYICICTQSVNTILGVSTSYSRIVLEADTTAGPFLTIPSCKSKSLYGNTVAQARTRARAAAHTNAAESQTNHPQPPPTKACDSYERHRTLYYIPGVFNMALQKLQVNCPIFVLAPRQVCRVETKSEYESAKPLRATTRERYRKLCYSARILGILHQVDYVGFVFPSSSKQTRRE